MLRESSAAAENEIDLRDVTAGLKHATDIPNAETLTEWAEAVVARDDADIGLARVNAISAIGDAAAVDAAAVIAAFHGFVRVADAIGIPYENAALGTDSTELRRQIGITDFFRAADDAL